MRSTDLFYLVKPAVPRWLQIRLRRELARQKRARNAASWPIDPLSATPPEGWPGWPSGKKFAFVLTHDVETAKGVELCRPLMKLEEELGVRSSFNFVPERYAVPPELRREMTSRGFEVGVHGLKHDGKLYSSREVFDERAARINGYLKEWKAVGFRSPSMQHNLDWIHALNIQYDLSTFDVDPFEPQSDGVGTIFPFVVESNEEGGHAYVEMPYTLPQDFTLFVILNERNPGIWNRKLDWVAEQGGMALVNVHPDYMRFDEGRPALDEYPASFYRDFLCHAISRHAGCYWHALPRDVAHFVATHVPKEAQEGSLCLTMSS
jgi:peptidoglycan/xylan/chitin deacetylase (PgdA/CDA1 family)